METGQREGELTLCETKNSNHNLKFLSLFWVYNGFFKNRYPVEVLPPKSRCSELLAAWKGEEGLL